MGGNDRAADVGKRAVPDRDAVGERALAKRQHVERPVDGQIAHGDAGEFDPHVRPKRESRRPDHRIADRVGRQRAVDGQVRDLEIAALAQLEERRAGEADHDRRSILGPRAAKAQRLVEADHPADDIFAGRKQQNVAIAGGVRRDHERVLARRNLPNRARRAELIAVAGFCVPRHADLGELHRLQIARRAVIGERPIGGIEKAVFGPDHLGGAALDREPGRRRGSPKQDIVLKRNTRDVVLDPKQVALAPRDEQVAPHHRVYGRRGPLLVGAGRQRHPRAVDHGVALDQRIVDLDIAVERRVRDAVHHRQRARESGAAKALHIVVAHDLVAVDDADAAGVVLAVPEKDVALDQIVVAMPQGQRPARAEKQVAAKDIAVGLVRDDLDLAVAAVEQVVLDDRAGAMHRILAGPDPDGLAAVGAEDGARAEIIVIDAVSVVAALGAVEADRQRDACVGLADQMVVIEAVVPPV